MLALYIHYNHAVHVILIFYNYFRGSNREAGGHCVIYRGNTWGAHKNAEEVNCRKLK
jgi:hypothetical protein